MAFRKSFKKESKKDGLRLTGLFQVDENRAAGTIKPADLEKLIDLAQTCIENDHGMRIMAFFNQPQDGKPDLGLLAYESIPQGKPAPAPKPRGPRMTHPSGEVDE